MGDTITPVSVSGLKSWTCAGGAVYAFDEGEWECERCGVDG